MKSDVTIIGGGPAGAACAIALSRAGVTCVLAERGTKADWKAGEIVDPKICFPLQELGLWEKFISRGYLRSAGTTSGWPQPTETSSSINPYGGSFFIDRTDFEKLLLAAAEAAGVKVLRGTAVRSAETKGPAWSISARSGGRSLVIDSGLLIEASGRGRTLAGPGVWRRIDSLTALIAYPDETRAVPDLRFCIEAAENGWWYASTLPHGKRVIAFMTDADMLPSGRDRRAEFFTANLERTQLVFDRFGKDTLPVGLRTVSAASSIRKVLNGDRWVCLGEAAASYDPLTGNGIYAAMSKGLALARVFLQESTPRSAFDKYAGAERAAFEDYLWQRRDTYRNGNRWPQSIFWKRRET